MSRPTKEELQEMLKQAEQAQKQTWWWSQSYLPAMPRLIQAQLELLEERERLLAGLRHIRAEFLEPYTAGYDEASFLLGEESRD